MRSLQQPPRIRCRSAVALQCRSIPHRRVATPAFNFKFDVDLSGLHDDQPQEPKVPAVFQLPKSARHLLQSVLDAQAAAEAAQRELLATGPLAEAPAKGNELIPSILSTHNTVQRLYHKALLPFLTQHPHYIDSPAGETRIRHRHNFCSCCYCFMLDVGSELWCYHSPVRSQAAARLVNWLQMKSHGLCADTGTA